MKRLTAFALSLLMVFSLVACGEETPPDTGGDPVTPQHGGLKPGGADNTSTPAPDNTSAGTEDPAAIMLTGNSYWVLETSEGDMRESPPEGDDLLTDLTLWADGTARIREIENGIWLINDGDEQNMTWAQGEDGTIHLYTAYSGEEPWCSGMATEDGIALSRFGGTFRFKQADMPEGGMLYAPAELEGVWLQIGSEVEGYLDENMPGRFSSLVFRTEWGEHGRMLLASGESGDYSSFLDDGFHDREITLLDQAIYEGCGNDEWSVRIGEEVPKNEDGYPKAGETEIYVTLLDQNTLLQQQYFSIDGGPAVAYQTYRRFLSEAPYDLEAEDLEGGDFELVGYVDADGVTQAEHPTYSSFDLHLDTEESGFFYQAVGHDGSEYSGGGYYWALGKGGTILMCGEDEYTDWLAGAVSYYDGMTDTPEILLWDNDGGILRLKHVYGSGGENYGGEGYADTMDDIEGRAFAAPENTLFVLYNQDYGDFTEYSWLRTYDLSDGPKAQYLLFTSVEDGSYFWLEEDGYCIEDFGTLDAGESILIRLEVPADGGSNLQVSTQLGDYFFELSQSTLIFDGGWNYITT